MILIDSIYVNNSGGKVLLDLMVNRIIEKKKQTDFFFLLDPRGDYSYLNEINHLIGKSRESFRKEFYKKEGKRFTRVLCFGNVPPPFRVKAKVDVYFHNVLLLHSVKGYPLRTRYLKFLKRSYILRNLKNCDTIIVQTEVVKGLFIEKLRNPKEIKSHSIFPPVFSGFNLET